MTYPEAAKWVMDRLQTEEEISAAVYGNHQNVEIWEIKPITPAEASTPKSPTIKPTPTVSFSAVSTELERPKTPPRSRSPTQRGSKGAKGGKGQRDSSTEPWKQRSRSPTPDPWQPSLGKGAPTGRGYPDSGWNRGGKGGGKGLSQSSSGPGKGSPQGNFDPVRDCRSCYANDRFYHHDYKTCEFNRMLAKLKREVREKEGKGQAPSPPLRNDA